MAISAGQVFVDLGARLDRKEFDLYERELKKVQERTAKREHFKAQLGADFDSRAFNSYERELKKTERANDDMVRANGRLRTAFGSVWSQGGAAFAAAGGAAAVVASVKSVVGAYGDAEASAKRVQTAVDNVGISYKAHREEIDRVIAAQSRLSAFDDEDLADSFARFVTQTKSVNEALKLNALAADVARGRQISLDAAQRLVARGALGNATALKRLGIEIDPVTRATDRLATSHGKVTAAQKAQAKEQDKIQTGQRVIAELQQKFGGQAEQYGKTQQGAIERVGVAWENLREKLGEKLAPTITRLANRTAKFVDEMTNGTGEGGKFADMLENDLVPALQDAAPLFKFLGGQVVSFGGWLRESRSDIRQWGEDAATVFGAVASGIKTVADLGSHLPGAAGRMFRSLSDDADDAAKHWRAFRQNLQVKDATDEAERNIRSLRRRATGDLDDIRKDTARNMRLIRHHLGTESQGGREALADNFDAARKAVARAMRRGEVSTRDGLREIRRLMREELRTLGIDSAQQKGAPLSPDPPKGGKVPVVRYMGGWLGGRGLVGHDTIPAMLAPGEAVLNRHQQAVIEGMLGDGFLDRLFATVNRPHFMQRGGRVRFARGGDAGGRFLQLPENIRPTHETAGLAGYPAQDIFGSPGTPVGAPVSGVIARLSGQAGGPGGGGPFGYSIYENGANGRSYFLTHFGSTSVRPGQHVNRGDIIGTVADYPDRPDHIHEGVHGGLTGITAGGPGGAAAVVWRAIKSPRTALSGLLGDVVQGTLDRATSLANRRGEALAATADPGGRGVVGPISGAGDPETIRAALRLAGQPASAANVRAIQILMGKESGGRDQTNPIAVNGEHATGLMQMLPSTFNAYKVAGHGNIHNALDNIAASVRYQMARYGHLVTTSPYARGGRVGKEAKWLQSMWSRVAPRYHMSPSSPLAGLFKHIRFSKDNAFVGVSSEPGAHGHDTDELVWPRWIFQSSNGQPALDLKTKQKLFIHEMAHRFQSGKATRTAWEAEGGAEAFARLVMNQQFGGYNPDAHDPYNAYARKVFKDHSSSWILREQFGRHSGGGFIRRFARGGRATAGPKSKLTRTVGGATAGLIRKISPLQTDRSSQFEALMARVDSADNEYSRWERRFNISDEELVDSDTGQINVAAIQRKAKELGQLIFIRAGMERDLEMARDVAKRIVASYRKVVAALRKSLRSAKGKNRTGIQSYISQYEPRIAEWQGKVGEVGGSLFDAHTDVLELKSELKDVLGTTAQIPTPDTTSDTGDTGGGDTGTDPTTADPTSPENAPPTPLQIAEAAAAEMRTFLSGRQDLLTSFGRNFVPAPMGAAYFNHPDALSAAGGVRAFGGGSVGGGLGGATIVNNYMQLPDNTQTWSEQMRFVVGG